MSKFKGSHRLISPKDIGKVLSIHTGRSVLQILITTKHVGHRLSEFSFTKTPAIYKK